MPLEKGHYPTWGLCILCSFTSCYMTGKLAWRWGRASLLEVLIFMLLQIIQVWPCAYASSHVFFYLYNMKLSKCSKRISAFFGLRHFRIVFMNRFMLLSWRMVLNVQLSDLDSWMLSLYLSSNLWSHSWCFKLLNGQLSTLSNFCYYFQLFV